RRVPRRLAGTGGGGVPAPRRGRRRRRYGLSGKAAPATVSASAAGRRPATRRARVASAVGRVTGRRGAVCRGSGLRARAPCDNRDGGAHLPRLGPCQTEDLVCAP